MALTVQMVSGQRITLQSDAALIGADETCDIVIAGDSRIQPHHARIRRVANRWIIESEGDWQIQVGAAMPGRKLWLASGDLVRLTQAGPEFVFFDGGLASDTASRLPSPETCDPSLPSLYSDTAPNKSAISAAQSEELSMDHMILEEAASRTYPPASHFDAQGIRSRLVLSLCWLGVFIFGIAAFWFAYNWDREHRVRLAVERGDALWQKGDKERAIEEYKAILNILPPGPNAATIYQRVVEHDLQKKNDVSARQLAETAQITKEGMPSLGEANDRPSGEARSDQVKAPKAEPILGEPLTAEHYPCPAGRQLYYWRTWYLPTGETKNRIYTLECETIGQDGSIVVTTLQYLAQLGARIGMLPEPVDSALPRTPTTRHRRVHGQFVEVKDEKDTPATEFYEPILRIGAKPGETWEFQESGLCWKYRYLRQLNYQGNPCVVIECETFADTLQTKNKSMGIQRRCYVKGQGLVYEEYEDKGEVSSMRWLTTRLDQPDTPPTLKERDIATKCDNPNVGVTDSRSRLKPLPTSGRRSDSPPFGARELTAAVRNVPDMPWWIRRNWNPRLRNVKAYGMPDRLIVTFDMNLDEQEEITNRFLYHFFIKLSDRNGQHLTHIITREAFTISEEAFRVGSETWNRLEQQRLTDVPAFQHVPKPVMLEATGNRLEYVVNMRDMQVVERIEIGFYELRN